MLSFLDERDERPRRRTSPRPITAGPTSGGPNLATRRIIALAVGLLLLLGLVLATRGCLESRKERSFKDYVREVNALVDESEQESDTFFSLFDDPEAGQGSVDLVNRVNEVRVTADQLVDRAKAVDHPDELTAAHRYLIQVLELRRDGLGEIGGRVNGELEPQARAIAAQMQFFLTSDVIYTQRFVPELERPLAEEGYLDEVEVRRRSDFLPDIGLLVPDTVSERLSGLADSTAQGPVAPGLHGNELGQVTVGGTALSPDATTTVTGGEDVAFAVQVTNSGENTEQNVQVSVTVSGAGRPITVEDQIEEIEVGATETVTIPLAAAPPTGRPVTVEVKVEPVPGEEKTDNNEGSFPVTFTG